MAFDFLSLFFFALDFVKGNFFVSVIVFLFVFFGALARQRLELAFKLSWFKSTLIVSFVFVLCLVSVVFFLPFIQASRIPVSYSVPIELQEDFSFQAKTFIFVILRLLIVSFLLQALILPGILAGAFLFDWISEHWGFFYFLRIFVPVFIIASIYSFFALFVFPFSLPGILFLVFFGFN